jgi:hypothetical protein
MGSMGEDRRHLPLVRGHWLRSSRSLRFLDTESALEFVGQ